MLITFITQTFTKKEVLMKEVAKIVLVSVVLPVAAQIAQQLAEDWLRRSQANKRRNKRWKIELM